MDRRTIDRFFMNKRLNLAYGFVKKIVGRHPRSDARCVDGECIMNKRFSCISFANSASPISMRAGICGEQEVMGALRPS